MNGIQFCTPGNISELADRLKNATVRSKILAGGTDLVISMNKGHADYDILIDMSGVEEFKYIKKEKGYIFIGANTTFSDIENNEIIKKYATCLSDAACMVGSPQIRNRATIAGNIGNASPAGDSLPPLLVMEAQVLILNSNGEIIERPLDKVLAGPGKTSLCFNEVITGIKFPIPDPQFKSTFAKVGSRSTVTIAKLSIALGLCYDDTNKCITNSRVALGAVGKTALRFVSVEYLLNNSKVTGNLSDDFADSLSDEIEKAIAGRNSMPYKREAVKGIAHQAINKLIP